MDVSGNSWNSELSYIILLEILVLFGKRLRDNLLLLESVKFVCKIY